MFRSPRLREPDEPEEFAWCKMAGDGCEVRAREERRGVMLKWRILGMATEFVWRR